jgi:hypothetical protein
MLFENVTVRDAVGDDKAALLALVKRFPTPTPCRHETFRALLFAKVNDLWRSSRH